jgi:hypothetical protein
MILRKALHLNTDDIINIDGHHYTVVSRRIISDRHSESDDIRVIVRQAFSAFSATTDQQIVFHKDDLVGMIIRASDITETASDPSDAAWKRFSAGS